MIKIEYECKVLTPMVVQGAEKNTSLRNDEDLVIRVPSLKGVLRFWWRLFCEEKDVKEVRKREGMLFGCIGEKKESLKSNVKIQTRILEQKVKNNVDFFLFKGDVSRKKKGGTFKGLGSETIFKVDFIINDTLYRVDDKKRIASNVLVEEIQETFETMALLGGLGLRSRRGFGTFQIRSKKIQSSKDKNSKQENVSWLTIEDVQNRIQRTDRRNFLHVRELIVVQRNFENSEDALRAIDEVSHSVRKELGEVLEKELGRKKAEYTLGKALGTANKRQPSPLYMSVFQESQYYKIVITILEENKNDKYREIQEKFIQQIRRKYEQ